MMAVMRRALLFGTAAAVALIWLGSLQASGSSAPESRNRGRSVWNGDIYVVNADGTGRRRLTRDPAEEFSPAWSPDGTRIALSRFTGRHFQIFVMGADGSGARRLTTGGSAATDAAWSPDGRRIAFTRCSSSCDIYVMDASGGGEIRLTRGEPPGDEAPTWSPDGSKIAFADLDGIFVVDADGSDPQRVTQGPADDSNPAWSPLGPEIAFDSSRGLFNGDIYVVNADGNGMHGITDTAPLDSNPSWSPDGRQIAFMRKQTRTARARVFVMNADGTGQTNLHAIGDAYSTPTWSPDGRRLAYSWLTACLVPQVAGKDLGDARDRIRRASCSIGWLRFTPSARPSGVVLSQQPQPRAERRIGSRVNLVVSRGR
jgi:Tol biopolymer transport system component